MIDVLSDVFANCRVGGVVFRNPELRPPWRIPFARSTKAGFHLVTHGACWLIASKRRPLRLERGDLVILPQIWEHALVDRASARDAPIPGPTQVLCGAYHVAGSELLSILPAVLVVRAGDADPIHEITRLIAREGSGPEAPGAQAMMKGLMDLLFIQALRGAIAREPSSAGWLNALRDHAVAAALSAIHREPARAWSIGDLARTAGASRATLVRRFVRLVRVAPMAYVRRWRLVLGARALRDTDESVRQIALITGYESEFAFTRAFRRVYGQAPTAYRKHLREEIAALSVRGAIPETVLRDATADFAPG